MHHVLKIGKVFCINQHVTEVNDVFAGDSFLLLRHVTPFKKYVFICPLPCKKLSLSIAK